MSIRKYFSFICFTLAVLMFPVKANEASLLLVHDAYPPECCEQNHCKPVACSEIHPAEKNGVLGWKWDKYFFSHYETRMFKGKTGCHVCVNWDTGTTYCIMPPFGT